jgi:hypothetical protein
MRVSFHISKFSKNRKVFRLLRSKMIERYTCDFLYVIFQLLQQLNLIIKNTLVFESLRKKNNNHSIKSKVP